MFRVILALHLRLQKMSHVNSIVNNTKEADKEKANDKKLVTRESVSAIWIVVEATLLLNFFWCSFKSRLILSGYSILHGIKSLVKIAQIFPWHCDLSENQPFNFSPSVTVGWLLLSRGSTCLKRALAGLFKLVSI